MSYDQLTGYIALIGTNDWHHCDDEDKKGKSVSNALEGSWPLPLNKPSSVAERRKKKRWRSEVSKREGRAELEKGEKDVENSPLALITVFTVLCGWKSVHQLHHMSRFGCPLSFSLPLLQLSASLSFISSPSRELIRVKNQLRGQSERNGKRRIRRRGDKKKSSYHKANVGLLSQVILYLGWQKYFESMESSLRGRKRKSRRQGEKNMKFNFASNFLLNKSSQR